jgi:hypothetical protein
MRCAVYLFIFWVYTYFLCILMYFVCLLRMILALGLMTQPMVCGGWVGGWVGDGWVAG